MQNKKKNRKVFLTREGYLNAGFVLPFAVLVSSILLAIGLSVYTIAIKELAISATGRESQLAFYAADTGGECALYWDVKHSGLLNSAFATSSYSVATSNGVVFCNEEDIVNPASGWDNSAWNVVTSIDGATTEFDMQFANGSCATVYVFKGSHTGGPETTRIDSHGFNTCDLSSTKRFERGVRIKY